ncbi:MAG: FUSC family protein, partial [Mycobacteriaceae bacterium]
MRASALAVLQCSVAASLAWFIATEVVGHPRPFFAPIAAVVCLGVSLGARLRRSVELVAGVSVGILVGDLLISQIGSGSWQIGLVVLLAMSTAVL